MLHPAALQSACAADAFRCGTAIRYQDPTTADRLLRSTALAIETPSGRAAYIALYGTDRTPELLGWLLEPAADAVLRDALLPVIGAALCNHGCAYAVPWSWLASEASAGLPMSGPVRERHFDAIRRRSRAVLRRVPPALVPVLLCVATRWPVLSVSALRDVAARYDTALVPLAVLNLAQCRPHAVLPRRRDLAAVVAASTVRTRPWWLALHYHLFGFVDADWWRWPAADADDEPCAALLTFGLRHHGLSPQSAAIPPPPDLRALALRRGWLRPLLTLLPTHWLRVDCPDAPGTITGGCLFDVACVFAGGRLREATLRRRRPLLAPAVPTSLCAHEPCVLRCGLAEQQLQLRWPEWYRAASVLLEDEDDEVRGLTTPPPSLAEVDAYLLPAGVPGNVRQWPIVTHLSVAFRTSSWHASWPHSSGV